MSLLPRATFVLLVVLVLSSSAAAQDAVRARGDSLRSAGDLAGAAEAYRDVLGRTGDDGGTAYALASTYALQPQYPDSAFYYLDLALAHEDTMKPLWDPDLYFLTDDERWAQVEATQLDKLAAQVTGTFNREYARQLEVACERGEADWSRYAHILDRTELERGNPQVYGTQMERNEATGRYEPRPMVDPEHVDERRAEKGMEPIDVQLRRFNESMQRDFGTSPEP